MKFLLVDDNETVRATVKDYLSILGFDDVIEAANGVAALSILGTEPIEFVISDWDMPEMKGIELLRLMKQSPEWQKIPFIIITAPESQEQVKINDAGISEVDGYIIKPFRAEILKEKIDLALANKKAVLENKNQPKPGGALVADDDPDSRDTIVEILASMGYDPIFQAEDGEKAWALLNTSYAEVSIVVSDWEMPNRKGIELLRSMRRSDRPGISSLPFVMVTAPGSVEKSKLIVAIDAEVDHYVIKPFAVADLKKAITHVLKKAKRRQQLNAVLQEAHQLVLDQKPDVAEQLYRHVMATHPADIRAYAELASIKMHRNEKPGFYVGEQLIRQGIQVNPLNDQGYVEMARLYERIMSLARAMAALNEGIEMCPESASLHFHLGRLLLRAGRREEARSELNKALKFDKTNTDALTLLAQTGS